MYTNMKTIKTQLVELNTPEEIRESERCFKEFASISFLEHLRHHGAPCDRPMYDDGFCTGAAFVSKQAAPMLLVALMGARMMSALEKVGHTSDYPIRLTADNEEDALEFDHSVQALAMALSRVVEPMNALIKEFNKTNGNDHE